MSIYCNNHERFNPCVIYFELGLIFSELF